MHITHIIKPAGIGGIEVMLRDILSYQQTVTGLNISLFVQISTSNKREFKKFIKFKNITWCCDDYSKENLKKYWDIHLKKYGAPDLIHSHHHRDTAFFEAIMPPQPKVATLHWTYTNSRQYSFFDAVIGNSEWQANNIPPKYLGNVYIIPNFYTPLREVNDSDISKIKKRAKCDDNTFIFGAIGRFTYQKGFDTLCRAFRIANIENSRLIIVGDSDNIKEKNDIINSAANDKRIFFPGFYENPSAFFHSFDCFVLSSRFESFGLVLTEAMSIGLPCIASRTYGPTDIIKKNPIIPQFQIDDEYELAELLRKSYNVGKKKYTYDLSDYDYTLYNKRLIKCYDEIINKKY